MRRPCGVSKADRDAALSPGPGRQPAQGIRRSESRRMPPMCIGLFEPENDGSATECCFGALPPAGPLRTVGIRLRRRSDAAAAGGGVRLQPQPGRAGSILVRFGLRRGGAATTAVRPTTSRSRVLRKRLGQRAESTDGTSSDAASVFVGGRCRGAERDLAGRRRFGAGAASSVPAASSAGAASESRPVVPPAFVRGAASVGPLRVATRPALARWLGNLASSRTSRRRAPGHLSSGGRPARRASHRRQMRSAWDAVCTG